MNDKKIDYVVSLITIIFIMLLIGKSGDISLGTIVSLLGVLVLSFIWPGAGLWIIIPIFVLVWFRHAPALFTYIKSLNERSIKT